MSAMMIDGINKAQRKGMIKNKGRKEKEIISQLRKEEKKKEKPK